MSSSNLKVLGLIGLGVVVVILAANNLSAWAWWETSGTQREMYDALIIGFNGLAGVCLIVGGALGADPYRDSSRDDTPEAGGAVLAISDGPSVFREMFYDAEGASAGYDLAIKLGFVILLCGHALIVYSRAVT